MNDSTYWVFAILVEDPNLLIQTLSDHGFDATSHSSLQPVPVLNRQLKQRHDSSAACQGLLPEIGNIHRHIVFVPLDIAMSESEIDRLGAAINWSKAAIPAITPLFGLWTPASNLSATDGDVP